MTVAECDTTSIETGGHAGFTHHKRSLTSRWVGPRHNLDHQQSLELCELGVLGIRIDGEWNAVRGERTRSTLAALSLARPHGVTSSALIDAVWPLPDQPPTARQSLANLVARLRTTYGDAIVETTGDGYRLGAGMASDRERLLSVVDDAQRLVDQDPEATLRSLDAALGRVRGRPWHDVDSPIGVEADRAQLGVHLERAHRVRASALIALGQVDEAIPLLEQLVEADPSDESRWLELASAQGALGRRVDALRTLRRARADLGEYGLTLGERAAEFERLVLQGASDVAGGGAEFPQFSTPLLGRDSAVGAVLETMGPGRLVTLCGPGGIGKTRLAVTVAQRCTAKERFFVDLSAVRDELLVASAVTASLDVLVPPGTAPTDALIDEFRTRDALVVVDNCEHVVGGAGQVAAAVIASCPSVQLLATSREHLAIGAERVIVIEPLPTESDGAGVELFFDRVRRLGVELPDDVWRGSVTELCVALDGLPLAIELAAGRATVLNPSEILDALEQRFEVLRDSDEGVSLERTIAWSWDLLTDEERRALRRLSVFQSGATLDAAAAVFELDRWSTLNLVQQLSRKSLVTIRHTVDHPTRVELLDTIRHFVRARAEDDGSLGRCRDAHLAWVDRFTVDALGEHGDGGLDDPLGAIDAERHELRNALDHAPTSPDGAAVGVRIAVRCFNWWRGRSTAPEGVAGLKRLIPLAELDVEDRVSAAATVASLARISAVPDAEVDALVADAHRLLETIPPSAERDRMELRLVEAEFDDSDPTLGAQLRRLVEVNPSSDDLTALHLLTAWTIANAPDEAPTVAARIARESRTHGAPCRAHARELEGLAAIATKQFHTASSALAEAIDLHEDTGQTFCTIHCCESVAWLAAETGDLHTARELLASTNGLRITHARTRAGFEEQAISGARRLLGELPDPNLNAEAEATIARARAVAAEKDQDLSVGT